MSYGFVYVLSNESMPGVYKIGMTQGAPSARCAQLSASSSSSHPFEVMFFMETKNPRSMERRMHDCFKSSRVAPNREFFKIDLRDIFIEFSSWETEGCILAVSYMATCLISCADYEDQKSSSFASLEVI